MRRAHAIPHLVPFSSQKHQVSPFGSEKQLLQKHLKWSEHARRIALAPSGSSSSLETSGMNVIHSVLSGID